MWLLMLKSIVVATDLAEPSWPALRTAARLAELAEASLHLLHVAGDPVPEGEALLREHFHRAAPDALEPASVAVVSGSPAAAIVDYAAHVDADAVVLGPHRRSGEGGEMGSTASSVVRTARCPCLVVARELRLPLERVMAPVDLSEVTGGALSVALSWASALRPREGNAQLTALHVTPSAVDERAEQAMCDEVQRARERAGGAAYVTLRELVRPARDAAEEILRAAASESVDLLVMGTRGAAGATSGLGSVSAAVARRNPCPLLLVPSAAWEQQTR